MMIVAGALITAAQAQTPAATRPSRSSSAQVRAILDAPDPSATIQAYAEGKAVGRESVVLQRAYLQRMLNFGLPEMAEVQARNLIQSDPDNGHAWAVAAYMDARRGDTTAALAKIVPAVKRLPHDRFALTTAGQLLAWYDTEADPAVVPEDVKKGLEDLRKDLANRPTYVEAYNQAVEVYRASAQAREQQPATQPAAEEAADVSVPTQPAEESGVSQAYPPAVTYPAPGQSYTSTEYVQEPYAVGYQYPAYPYFAASYPTYYPSYGFADYWWPSYGLPSYWWWWPRTAVIVAPHHHRGLLAAGLLRHGLRALHGALHHHRGVLVAPRHGFARHGLRSGIASGRHTPRHGLAGSVTGRSRVPVRAEGALGDVRPRDAFGFTRGNASGRVSGRSGAPAISRRAPAVASGQTRTSARSGTGGVSALQQPSRSLRTPVRTTPSLRTATPSFRTPTRATPSFRTTTPSFRTPTRAAPSFSYRTPTRVPRTYAAPSFRSGVSRAPRGPAISSFRGGGVPRSGFTARSTPFRGGSAMRSGGFRGGGGFRSSPGMVRGRVGARR